MRFLISFTVFFIHCSIGFCQLDKVTAPFITSFNITELGVRNVEQLKQAENGLYYMATSAGLLETDRVNHFLYRKGKRRLFVILYTRVQQKILCLYRVMKVL